MYSKEPYSCALAALQTRYGQPRQLIQGEIDTLLSTPPIKIGDNAAFQEFTLSVRSLVGLLESVEGEKGSELKCGSHVDKLLSKLPPSYRDGFIEHCYNYGILKDGTSRTYTLHQSVWLETKARARIVAQQTSNVHWEKKELVHKVVRGKENPSTLYLTETSLRPAVPTNPQPKSMESSMEAGPKKKPPTNDRNKFRPYCPFHNNLLWFMPRGDEVYSSSVKKSGSPTTKGVLNVLVAIHQIDAP